MGFDSCLVGVPLMIIFIWRNWPLRLIDHYRLTNDIYIAYDIGLTFSSVFACVPQSSLKRILQIALEFSATIVFFQGICGIDVMMHEILVIGLHNQLLFWQNWIFFLKLWTFVKDLRPTKMIIRERKLLELHVILLFSNLNPDLARMNDFHASCILLTALFRNFVYCSWPLPLLNSWRIKSSISTTRGGESVGANLHNFGCVSPSNNSITRLPFKLQRIIQDCKIRLHIQVSFLAVNLGYLWWRLLCIRGCCPILSIGTLHVESIFESF